MLRKNRIVIATTLLLTIQLATAEENATTQSFANIFSRFFSTNTAESDVQGADATDTKNRTSTTIFGLRKDKPKWSAINPHAFNKIIIDGQSHVVIDPQSKDRISVWDHSATLGVSDDTLFIHTQFESDDEAHYNNVILRDMNDVKMIRVRDNASLTTKKSNNKNKTKMGPISLVVEGHGDVTLEGMFDIKKLIHSSDGKSNLLWIDSPEIEVIAKNGSVKLAGVTKNAKIWGYGDARIHASHLRSDNTWVRGTDHSFIESNPIGYFYAHASKHSTIWHRGNYTTISSITENHGNLLYTNS